MSNLELILCYNIECIFSPHGSQPVGDLGDSLSWRAENMRWSNSGS